MALILSPVEARALACLVEKSITTPDYYPLTLNALTAACNQKSNREPVMQLDEKDVVRALDSLREKKLAWVVTTTGGRAPKYRHSLPDVYDLTPLQVAVLCELLLRGPQTAGELRTRAARLTALAEVGEVQTTLRELTEWAGSALAVRLPRQIGQREERYAHALCGAVPAAEAAPAQPAAEPARVAVVAENERMAALEARVKALEAQHEQLRTSFTELAKQLQ